MHCDSVGMLYYVIDSVQFMQKNVVQKKIMECRVATTRKFCCDGTAKKKVGWIRNSTGVIVSPTAATKYDEHNDDGGRGGRVERKPLVRLFVAAGSNNFLLFKPSTSLLGVRLPSTPFFLLPLFLLPSVVDPS